MSGATAPVTPSPDSANSVQTSSRAQALDIVRALAAVLVLTYHVWLYALPNPNRPFRAGFTDHVFFELRTGLIVFLVMTGYLLYKPFVTGRGVTVAPSQFIRRRLFRIVPAYYAALAGTFILLWWNDGAPGVRLPPAEQLPLFLVFGQNYSRETLLTFDAPTWTLAVQAAFYVALPLIAIAAVKLKPRGWLVPLALFAVGLVWNAIAYESEWGPIARLALPALIGYFACGMLIAHVPRLKPGSRSIAVVAVAGIAIAVADMTWHSLAGTGVVVGIVRDLPAAIGFALLVYAAACAAFSGKTWARPFEAVGRWSYGIFLWHVPLLLWLRANGLRPEFWLFDWLLTLGLACIFGAASWRWLERPLLARSKGQASAMLASQPNS